MNQGIPRRTKVSSKKVAELVFEKIFPALQGEPLDAMVMSLVCAAALAMKPNCDTDKLQEVIMETSGYLINQLQDDVQATNAN